MEKTYEQKVHYRIVIEGDYTMREKLKEELYDEPEEAYDCIIDWLYDDFGDVVHNSKFQVELSDLSAKEEC